MADDEVKYELKTVRTIRGTEGRTTAKWQKDGWEVVAQRQGTLRTLIDFRRPKAKTPWRRLAIVGGVVLALAIPAIIVGAVQGGGDNPRPTGSPTGGAVAPSTRHSEQPSEPAEEETLTAANSGELAAILVGPDQGATIEEFAAKYKGRVIAFDGSIGAMAPHGDYKTRYDILISNGDYSESHSSGGPSFQFRDVNVTNDLNLTGPNIPDTVRVGDNLHFVARVGTFNPDSLLFFFEPVSTQYR